MLDTFKKFLLKKYLVLNEKNINYSFKYKKNLPVLISSQLQRCGGTLFTQLFDNHPEILSHPWEIMVYKEGYGNFYSKIIKTNKELKRLSKKGYKKSLHSTKVHNFFFLYNNFKSKLLEINFYFNEFFKYWVNYKNSSKKKKIITGFSPFFCKKNLEKIMRENKRLNIVHIYRNPLSWWSSAKNYKEKYKKINSIKKYWESSQKEAIKIKLLYPKRVFIIDFENMITKRKSLINYFCKKFSIKFNKNLLYPTFNGELIENDSTFKNQKTDKYGIIKNVTKRYNELLNKNEIRYIKSNTSKTIKKIKKLSINL